MPGPARDVVPLADGGAGVGVGGAPVVRRPGRADRGHAAHPGRGAPLDRCRAVPARAELLHHPAGARGDAAGGLHRLAAQRGPGRAGRGHAVRAAGRPGAVRAVGGLRRLRYDDAGGRRLRRHRAGRALDRRAGRRPGRPSCPRPPGAGGYRGRRVRRAGTVRCAVPAGRAGGRGGGLAARPLPARLDDAGRDRRRGSGAARGRRRTAQRTARAPAYRHGAARGPAGLVGAGGPRRPLDRSRQHPVYGGLCSSPAPRW